LRRGTEKFTV